MLTNTNAVKTTTRLIALLTQLCASVQSLRQRHAVPLQAACRHDMPELPVPCEVGPTYASQHIDGGPNRRSSRCATDAQGSLMTDETELETAKTDVGDAGIGMTSVVVMLAVLAVLVVGIFWALPAYFGSQMIQVTIRN
jgi:hypothetical protein